MARQRKQHILYTVGDVRDFLLAEKWDRPIPESVARSQCERSRWYTDSQRQLRDTQSGLLNTRYKGWSISG